MTHSRTAQDVPGVLPHVFLGTLMASNEDSQDFARGFALEFLGGWEDCRAFPIPHGVTEDFAQGSQQVSRIAIDFLKAICNVEIALESQGSSVEHGFTTLSRIGYSFSGTSVRIPMGCLTQLPQNLKGYPWSMDSRFP